MAKYSKDTFKGRRFVCGDLHGGYKGLKQCLEGVGFDYENDLLIQLGDLCDGWSETKECIDELLKIKNLIFIIGNHDMWVSMYYKGQLRTGFSGSLYTWLVQGGDATRRSLGEVGEVDKKYLDFLESGLRYYKIDGKIFSHGDIPKCKEDIFDDINISNFIWSRDLLLGLKNGIEGIEDTRFTEIYLGHTPVNYLCDNEDYLPLNFGNVWALDTGAAFMGKITIMDIDTKDFYQSDYLYKLYSDERGRNKSSYNELNK